MTITDTIYLWTPEGEPTGGTPAPSPAPATGEPTAQPTAQPNANAAPAGAPNQPADKSFTYKEDRSNWLPPHRAGEFTRTIRTHEQRLAELQAENQRYRTALGAPSQPGQGDADRQAALNALRQLAPQLVPLLEMSPEEVAALRGVPQNVQAAQQAEDANWKRHGRVVTNAVISAVGKAVGTDLNPGQQSQIRALFPVWFKETIAAELQAAGWVSEEESGDADNFSETLRKYIDNDPSVADAFVNQFKTNWFDPFKRTAASQIVSGAPKVPRTRPGTPAVTGGDAPQFKKKEGATVDEILNERLDYVVQQKKRQGAFQ